MTEIDRTPAEVADFPHVVVVGAGFGGLNLARAMGGTGIRVTQPENLTGF